MFVCTHWIFWQDFFYFDIAQFSSNNESQFKKTESKNDKIICTAPLDKCFNTKQKLTAIGSLNFIVHCLNFALV